MFNSEASALCDLFDDQPFKETTGSAEGTDSCRDVRSATSLSGEVMKAEMIFAVLKLDCSSVIAWVADASISRVRLGVELPSAIGM